MSSSEIKHMNLTSRGATFDQGRRGATAPPLNEPLLVILSLASPPGSCVASLWKWREEAGKTWTCIHVHVIIHKCFSQSFHQNDICDTQPGHVCAGTLCHLLMIMSKLGVIFHRVDSQQLSSAVVSTTSSTTLLSPVRLQHKWTSRREDPFGVHGKYGH